jgi:hypothetical protein
MNSASLMVQTDVVTPSDILKVKVLAKKIERPSVQNCYTHPMQYTIATLSIVAIERKIERRNEVEYDWNKK